jgi:hypothetical protein
MKFLDRMALLVKADAHGVMDQLEERTTGVAVAVQASTRAPGRSRRKPPICM